MADCTVELDPTFRVKAHEVQRICIAEGTTIHFYCALRTCEAQAKLFRQSRTIAESNQRAQSLRDKGYPFLANVLMDVGPQAGELGRHVTHAAPGESWHQYGMAVDGVPIHLGKAIWNAEDPAWQIYGAAARHVGATWAGDWTSFREMPHIQLYPASSPIRHFNNPDKIRDMLVATQTLG